MSESFLTCYIFGGGKRIKRPYCSSIAVIFALIGFSKKPTAVKQQQHVLSMA